jgi:hypothetical protein
MSTPENAGPSASITAARVGAALHAGAIRLTTETLTAAADAGDVIESAFTLLARSEGAEAVALAPSRDRLANKAAQKIAAADAAGVGIDRSQWHLWVAKQFNRPVSFAETLDREMVLAYSTAQMARLMVDATRVEMRLREFGHPAVLADLLQNAGSEEAKAKIRVKAAEAVRQADELGNSLDGIPPEIARVLLSVRSSLTAAREISRVLPSGASGEHARRQLGDAFGVIETRYQTALMRLVELDERDHGADLPGKFNSKGGPSPR